MTAKGQITITSDIRQKLGLHAGDEVMMTAMPDGTVRLRRLPSPDEFMKSLPLATVPPIDWKALRRERAEELAEGTLQTIAEAGKRRRGSRAAG